MPFRSLRLLAGGYCLVLCGCAPAANPSPSADPAPSAGNTSAAHAPGDKQDAIHVETSRPIVDSSRELTKILDLRTLPEIAGTKYSVKTAVALLAEAPENVVPVAKHYRTLLSERGWTEQTGPANTLSDEYGSLTFTKDGHHLFLSLSANNGKDAPNTRFDFLFYGNFDARTLPRSAPKWEYGSQIGTIYASEKTVPQEAEWVEDALSKAGWEKFTTFNPSPNDPQADHRVFTYRKKAYSVSVYISLAPAMENKTSVQYSTYALAHELPAPPSATQIEFVDAEGRMKCQAPSDLHQTTAFYQQAMPAIGFEPLPGEEPTDTYRNLRFGSPEGDITLVQLVKNEPSGTRVLLVSVPVAVLKKLKQDEQKNKDDEAKRANQPAEAAPSEK